MFLEERQLQISEFLKNKNAVTIHQLVKKFNISLPTIRRDLSRLEQQGIITRTHGGAIIKGDFFIETTFQKRIQKFINEKRKIAQYVVSKLIQQGDTIILDTGTTTFLVASLIRQQHLSGIKIITNSIKNATELAFCQGITHILVGGKVQPETLSLVGPEAIKSLNGFHVDKAFIGIAGLHWENGLTDIDSEEVFVKKEFLKIAKQKIILTDHSKVGKTFFVNICSLSEIDIVVMDSDLDKKLKNKLDKTNVNFIYV